MIGEFQKEIEARNESVMQIKSRRKPKPNSVYASSARTYGGSGLGNHDTRSLRLYAAVRDHVYTALRPAAFKIASQPIHVGYGIKKRKSAQRFQKTYTQIGSNKSFWKKAFKFVTKPFSKKTKMWKGIPDRMKKSFGQGVEVTEGHALSYLLEDPNEFMTQWSLLYCTVISIMATGKSFWWVNKNKKKDCGYSIYYLPSHWVARVSDENNAIKHWLVRPHNSTTEFEVDPKDMIYFPFPDPANPIDTYAPVQAQARAINTDDKIQTAQQEAMNNGVFPGVIVKAGELPLPNGSPAGSRPMRPHMTPEQRKELVTTIKTYAGGAYNFNEPFIVDGMIEDIVPFTHRPRDMEFASAAEVTRKRIMQGIGTNEYVAGAPENSNRATATVAEDLHNSIQVNPIITLMSQVLTKYFSPKMSGKRKKLHIWIEKAEAFDADALKARVQMAPDTLTTGQIRRFIETGEVDFTEEQLADENPYGGGGFGADPYADPYMEEEGFEEYSEGDEFVDFNEEERLEEEQAEDDLYYSFKGLNGKSRKIEKSKRVNLPIETQKKIKRLWREYP